MFNKIMNSPFVLGLLLSVFHIAYSGYTGAVATVISIILTFLLIALYTCVTQFTFSKNFKYLTVLSTFIAGFTIDAIFFGKIADVLTNTADEGVHPGAAIVIITLTALVVSGLNYFYLTYGNKLGLWIANKTK
jgi:hypothetical protein